MPLLPSSIIIPNHLSAEADREVTREYIRTEFALGRMEGPLSHAEMERVCRGPFYASPLLVSYNDQGPGLDPKKRVCQDLSMGNPSFGTRAVNDFIDKLDFPSHFDMAPKMAKVVSSHSSFSIFPSSISLLGATPLLCQSFGCGPLQNTIASISRCALTVPIGALRRLLFPCASALCCRCAVTHCAHLHVFSYHAP